MPADRVHYFENSQDAGMFLKDFIIENDIILLKASQSIRLERATALLLADKSKVTELLVRQDKEWKIR